MLFNSFEFIFVFLPIVTGIFFVLSQVRFRQTATISLIVASLLFYSFWDIKYLPLLLTSICFNYLMGTIIEKNRGRNFLAFAIGIDLCVLGYYKYTNFFVDTVNSLLGTSIVVQQIILPLGVSFFTFTQIAYLIDAYRGETKEYTFLNYSLFVTFFPHLIAGPILYHKDIIPQFQSLRHFVFSNRNIAIGIAFFCIGLFKKVIIADTLSAWVSPVFSQAASMTLIEAWAGALAYTLQLYFDFSGYSDMAVGLGRMLNIKMPINFASPYKAMSIIDFWRRWHITLSTFLRNYLYIPLGGNRNGEYRRYRNLFITMLLGGLWHGAGWTFVIWGGLHGLYLVVNHAWTKMQIVLPSVVCWLLTFASVVIAWVFFRASSVSEAMKLLAAMTGANGVTLPLTYSSNLAFLSNWGVSFNTMPGLVDGFYELIVVALLIIVVAFVPNTQIIVARVEPKRKYALIFAVIFLVALLNMNRVTEFLYFQF